MTYALSAIMNLKIIAKIFIQMSWYSRKKMMILVKLCFWTFSLKFMIRNLPLGYLLKETSFPFISIAWSIRIAMYHLKYFMLQSVLKLYALPRKQQTWLICQHLSNVLLMRIKKQGSDCTCIISLLKKAFGMFMCIIFMCIYLCVYVYVYYVCMFIYMYIYF